MATTPLKRPRYRISSTTTATNLPPLPPPPQSTYMDDDTEDDDFDQKNYNLNPIPNPSIWFTKLLSFQSEMTHNFLSSLLSPFSSLLSVTTESYHQVTETKDSDESAVAAAPAAVTNVGGVLLKKIGLGLLGALYVCMVLTMVMVVAIVLGVGLVKMWVEEPVFVREKLHFDYTNAHPEATLSFGGICGGFGGGGGLEGCYLKRNMGVPVGHTFSVYVVLLLPESYYNRELGVFQLSADLISTRGDVIARSSQPCMLKFRSFPIRLMRTFFMGIPLLLGLTAETQTIVVPMLKHKEGYPRTESIRISLIPRAGTSFVPQIYESDIIMNSQLPWSKEIVYSWKWTFYVWTSLYMYIILLIVLGCCFKRRLFPSIDWESTTVGEAKEAVEGRSREEREVAESLSRWRRNRNRRKAVISRGGAVSEKVASSAAASSITVTREEAAPATDEDAGDSESSVCFGGEQDSLI